MIKGRTVEVRVGDPGVDIERGFTYGRD